MKAHINAWRSAQLRIQITTADPHLMFIKTAFGVFKAALESDLHVEFLAVLVQSAQVVEVLLAVGHQLLPLGRRQLEGLQHTHPLLALHAALHVGQLPHIPHHQLQHLDRATVHSGSFGSGRMLVEQVSA